MYTELQRDDQQDGEDRGRFAQTFQNLHWFEAGLI
jgi:hypothetical protein